MDDGIIGSNGLNIFNNTKLMVYFKYKIKDCREIIHSLFQVQQNKSTFSTYFNQHRAILRTL